jgi:hypothetical protein
MDNTTSAVPGIVFDESHVYQPEDISEESVIFTAATMNRFNSLHLLILIHTDSLCWASHARTSERLDFNHIITESPAPDHHELEEEDRIQA